MILSELIPFLKEIGAAPKKHLSQNFLIDPQVAERIVELGDISPGDAVLEIGSGPGCLTSLLLKKRAQVYAVEIDPLFAQALGRLDPEGKLKISPSDFLSFPMDILPKNIKVVANLPYHITTPILEKLFSSSFTTLTLMVQKEVGERMASPPGSKQFGSLSLFVQFYSNIDHLFSVPAACFYPKPKVDSTVIRLSKAPIREIAPSPFFFLVRQAFQKRRKMLSSSLPLPKEKIQNGLKICGIRPDARPEMLSLREWIQFAKEMEPFLPEEEKKVPFHLFNGD